MHPCPPPPPPPPQVDWHAVIHKMAPPASMQRVTDKPPPRRPPGHHSPANGRASPHGHWHPGPNLNASLTTMGSLDSTGSNGLITPEHISHGTELRDAVMAPSLGSSMPCALWDC